MAVHAVEKDDVPAEEAEKPAPLPFTVGYKRGSGEVTVFGNLALGAIFISTGFLTGLPLLSVAGLAPIAYAYRSYPMLEAGRPQLGANADGLYIDRIGFIDWKAIRMTEIGQNPKETKDRVLLNVLLTRPTGDAVTKAQKIPVWKKYMMRNWKRSQREHGRELIAVNLQTLDADPDDILSRIRTFKRV